MGNYYNYCSHICRVGSCGSYCKYNIGTIMGSKRLLDFQIIENGHSRRETINMLTKNKAVLVIIIGLVLLSFCCIGLLTFTSPQEPSDCTDKQKYSYSEKRCRDKTESELAQEEKERQEELERQEKVRKEADVAKKKQSGEICLSAAESWNNIGKITCVAFHPGYFYSTGYGRMFINEKEDYRNGFVAYLVYNYMTSWDNLLANYRVPMIAVSGTITQYEGHPQIQVYDLNQITIPTKLHCDTSYGCVYSR